MPTTNAALNGGSATKSTCPYCDMVFMFAMSLSVAALVLSLLQSAYAIWALLVFIVTLANCFCQYRVKKHGLMAAGLVQCSYGLFLVADLLNMQSNCDPVVHQSNYYLPCDMLYMAATTAGLWVVSGSLILHFVFSGRIKNYIKEGLEIEAVATPLGSVEEEMDDLESGQDDEEFDGDSVVSGSDEEIHSDEGEDGEDHSDNDSNSESEPTAVAVSATICDIPENEMEGVPEELREKLAQSIGVPLTPARPLEASERSTVAYLPTGQRDWDARSRS